MGGQNIFDAADALEEGKYTYCGELFRHIIDFYDNYFKMNATIFTNIHNRFNASRPEAKDKVTRHSGLHTKHTHWQGCQLPHIWRNAHGFKLYAHAINITANLCYGKSKDSLQNIVFFTFLASPRIEDVTTLPDKFCENKRVLHLGQHGNHKA